MALPSSKYSSSYINDEEIQEETRSAYQNAQINYDDEQTNRFIPKSYEEYDDEETRHAFPRHDQHRELQTQKHEKEGLNLVKYQSQVNHNYFNEENSRGQIDMNIFERVLEKYVI